MARAQRQFSTLPLPQRGRIGRGGGSVNTNAGADAFTTAFDRTRRRRRMEEARDEIDRNTPEQPVEILEPIPADSLFAETPGTGVNDADVVRDLDQTQPFIPNQTRRRRALRSRRTGLA